MKTESILLTTLCVPCVNRCRHCLLRWDGRITGADFDRSAALAVRLLDWIRTERPELSFNFTYGYSMDHPQLAAALDTLDSLGSVMSRFMHMDGLRIRNEAESKALLDTMKTHGVGELNFTFYGTEEYHDAFAGRKGDFRFLLMLARLAREREFRISCGVMFTRESAPLLEELIPQLEAAGFSREDRGIRLIVPHSEGRGRALEPIRAGLPELEALDEGVRSLMNRNVFRTEAEWIASGLEDETRRMILILLTDENIARYEGMPAADIVAEAEALDDGYYGALPPVKTLEEAYGDPHGDRLFSKKDLFDRWRKRWIAENGLKLYDVTNETQTGSRRY